MGFKEDNEAGLRDKERLKHEASEVKKGANEKLREHNENAENGPDGAQRLQPLPEDVHVEANAEPLSKPQNTFEANHVDPEGDQPLPAEDKPKRSSRRKTEDKATPDQ